MENLNFKNIWLRIKADTPPFWKQLRKIFGACLVIGGAISTLDTNQAAWLFKYLPDHTGAALTTIGTVGVALCSLTKTDEPPSQQN